jgi:hypothetical protein
MALENAAELSLSDLKPYVRSICPETFRQYGALVDA